MIALVVFCRSLVTGLAVAGAIYLAQAEKAGWGWMIFLAICLGTYSISRKKDEE